MSIPKHPDRFIDRHIGPRPEEIPGMIETLGVASLDALMDATVPPGIRLGRPLDLPAPVSESGILADLAGLAARNQVARSFIGMGYSGTVTPPVIQRNVLENPGWYTQYTPYQPEIAQGRLTALLNFQTLVMDLTGLDIANASVLDEATGAAEAMTLARRVLDRKAPGNVFFVSARCHPQTIEVVRTRAIPLGIRVVTGDEEEFDRTPGVFGLLLQYPASDGAILDYAPLCARAHAAGALVTVAADLLALTVLRPPGEFGADVVVGNSQRFGVPLGFGGPHAGFMATRDAFKRQLPGRIVGLSKDAEGRPAIRLALQTREQHIRRDKATSNICTAQVLLAVIASMYAVYHGPDGLRAIARRVHAQAAALAGALRRAGWAIRSPLFFDTLRIGPGPRPGGAVFEAAREAGFNLRRHDDGDLGIALDETVSDADLAALAALFGADAEFADAGAPFPSRTPARPAS